MGQAESGTVLSTKSPTEGQIILHLDMDCFFAACERLRRPELRGEPVVIGGGFEEEPPRGVVATASYEAREFGIHSAQPMAEALEKLPRRKSTPNSDSPTGIYLKGDHSYYSEISEEVMAIASDFAQTLQRVSIDEAYLDVTEQSTWDSVEADAVALKSQIEEEVGIEASVGIAPTKSCAKIASDYEKPDGLCLVSPGEVKEFLAPLDIGEVHGIGPVGAEQFRTAGIETAGDLAALSTQEVIDRFGSRATTLYDRVRGIDPREVESGGQAKSISKETSIEPTTAMSVKEGIIRDLADQVAERAVTKGAHYQTVGIKVVATPFDRMTRERSLAGPIQNAELVRNVARELLEEFDDTELRKLGVKLAKLSFFDGEQTKVSTWSSDRGITTRRDFHTTQLGQAKLSEYL